ncbi:unnamed protein product [Arctia plantaginis]|uniref:CCDC92/74 N-terminal domain-containing protein n=1 Tax=Arctia plantaginis TaxID=874455 RepID=A0A8S1BV31_ARCPL|nr:unnamed protein product [Arctia plantaginis]
MASKVLVPVAPFAKLQVKKTPPESTSSAYIIGGDPVARVAHLEHSVRFLQEQHRLMLSGLHTEIEALRERNRDLQFQLIFNKESTPKVTSQPIDENVETEETRLKREVARLEREASAARGEARAAEARALQLQTLVDAQTEKLRLVELKEEARAAEGAEGAEGGAEGASRGELRARLGEAERLVRRLRADAERQRREVLAPSSGAVTNLLFDGAAARHAHVRLSPHAPAHSLTDSPASPDRHPTAELTRSPCMKNSLHASLRASGLDGYGYQNNYHFPPVHTPDFWREPLRDDFNIVASRGRSTRRPLTLPELSGQPIHRSTIYANKFAENVRPRANGYEKNKKAQPTNSEVIHNTTAKSHEEATERRIRPMVELPNASDDYKTNSIYPELKFVVTRLITDGQVSNGQSSESVSRARARRGHKHAAGADHT